MSRLNGQAILKEGMVSDAYPQAGVRLGGGVNFGGGDVEVNL